MSIDVMAGGDLSQVPADWLAIPVSERDRVWPFDALDRAAAGEITRALQTGEFKPSAFNVFVTPIVSPDMTARRLVLIGTGAEDVDTATAFKSAAAAALAARERRASSLAFVNRFAAPSDESRARLTQAVAEGLTFATFDAAPYKTADHEAWNPTRLAVAFPGEAPAPGIVEAARRGAVVGECVNLARGLANEPGNRLRPREFAERAASAAAAHRVAVEILDEATIAGLGMGLLRGVAQGSDEPPRVLVLRYEPAEAASSETLGLVGKGVTFDTGGISIKPSQGMEKMKDDMAGGAAVVAALCAVARLGAPRRVTGVVPIAENMPGGTAIRPGDVLTSASGKTVEVLDTDAEGRLILADGLWYARRLGATHLVDIATLTGACMVALGKVTSGLFGRPETWVDVVRRAAGVAGDRLWPLPLFAEYRDQLKSEIADIVNVGGRPAGAITAAMFLAEFAGDGPWAHLDIAGTAWNEDAKPWMPKGPSGAGVRTLAQLAWEQRY